MTQDDTRDGQGETRPSPEGHGEASAEASWDEGIWLEQLSGKSWGLLDKEMKKQIWEEGKWIRTQILKVISLRCLWDTWVEMTSRQ